MATPFIAERVSTLDLPELLPYRTLRRPVEHFQRGIVVAEGERVAFRLLASGLEVESLLITPEWFERVSAAYRGTQKRPIRAFLADRALLQQIVGYHLHQGIMAVGRVPPEPSIDQIPSPHMLVALDGLAHAENVGVIVRNCAALGADAVISGKNSSSPYLRRAARSSMGAVFSLPIFHADDLGMALQAIRSRHGTRIIAAHVGSSVSIAEGDFRGNVCLVVGNEDSGISPGVLALADQRMSIHMKRGTDSLNVASAVAVFLFEAARRREHAQDRPTDDHRDSTTGG